MTRKRYLRQPNAVSSGLRSANSQTCFESLLFPLSINLSPSSSSYSISSLHAIVNDFPQKYCQNTTNKMVFLQIVGSQQVCMYIKNIIIYPSESLG